MTVFSRRLIVFTLVIFITKTNFFAIGNSSISAFIENKGQIVDQNYHENKDVLYQYVGKGIKVQLRKTGYSYELFTATNLPKIQPGKKTPDNIRDLSNAKIICNRIDIDFKDKLSTSTVFAEEVAMSNLNYVINGLETYGVRAFKKVMYKNVYRNIDIEFLIDESRSIPLKYNVILNEGANLADVQFVCNGADKISRSIDGKIVFTTSGGSISEDIPFSYYSDLENTNIPVDFILKNNIISFQTEYDNTKTLVIDPSSNLVWGNYVGGTALDYCTGLSRDAQNNLYMIGYTLSNSNIATSGVYQTTLSGSFDGYLIKYNSNGIMQWGTYFGGTDVEAVYSLYVEPTGAIYVGGDTFSNNNIASAGAHQVTYGGGIDDAFLFKFDATGQRIWSTYFGGTEHEIVGALTVDGNGNVIICGHTESTNAIATTGAYNTIYALAYDVYIAKFNSNGVLQWGTYYGDTGVDEAWGIACDAQNNIYITGFTSSMFGISTGGGHQTTNGGGNNDAFISKFDAAGVNLLWGSYYGGAGDDGGTALEVDANGKVFLAGNTSSTLNIATAVSHQSVIGSAEDGFVAQFNASGVRQWATYFGGSEVDYIYDLVIDSSNDILFCGQTLSPNAIATIGAYQTAMANVNNYEAYFAKFSNSGNLQSASYYGGEESETAKGIAIDAQSKVYLAGETTSTVGISTPNSQSTVQIGNGDAFISKFCINSIIPLTPATNTTICLNDTLIISAPVGCISYTWNTSANTYSILVSNTITVGSFTYSVKVVDADGCDAISDTIQVDIEECTTGINRQIGEDAMTIFPNPTNSKATILFNQTWSQTHLKLFSSMGQLLMEIPVYTKEVVLDLNEYNSGIYFLMIKQNGNSTTKKLIKQ